MTKTTEIDTANRSRNHKVYEDRIAAIDGDNIVYSTEVIV